MLSAPDSTRERVLVGDKALINSRADLNAVFPLKYNWAWNDYQDSLASHWIPEEVLMTADIRQWKSDNLLTDEERTVIKRSLGFFSTADSLVANNLVLAVYKHITNPECRQYLLRQASEEANHTGSYCYCVQSLGMDEGEIFNMYHEIPSVAAKAEWAIQHTRRLADPNFETGTIDADRALLEDLIAFYPVMEGIFFYAGFALILSLKRRNLMVGTCEQFEFIMRDETGHFHFGNKMILGIIQENPHLWDDEMKAKASKMITEGVDLEIAFARDAMPPEGLTDLKVKDIEGHIKFVGNRRLSQLGLTGVYNNRETKPLKWLSVISDLPKETNFFERTVTEYSKAPLDWD